MVAFAINIIKAARPRQWLKNLSVAAALVFSRKLFELDLLLVTLQAVAAYCAISSAIYYFNDIADRHSDNLHPFKRFRPIAAGKITVRQAYFIAFLLATFGLWIAYNISTYFLIVIIGYVAIQIAYSLSLKHIAILDMLIIAGGFIMRVYAGSLAIHAHLSIWFLLCVVSVALLIAVGKRRAELAILDENSAKEHRKVLAKYPKEVLNSYVAMFANAAFMSWSLFTFFEPTPEIVQSYPSFFASLPPQLSGTNKWLMTTIPIVIYGIMRYIRIIYDGSKAESPERVLLNDKPLLVTAFTWGLMIIIIIYILPGGA